MMRITDFPGLSFLLSFVLLWLSALFGSRVLRRWGGVDEAIRDNFGLIVAGALTILGLIIGFSFSMAAGRYDQRKNYEEAEANAIGTESLRADLLPAADAANVRALLRSYLDQRILFYTARDEGRLAEINTRTAQLQAALWSSVLAPAAAQPTAVAALAVSGMNDVLNSQGYTQAAWWNRLPRASWFLMVGIAVLSAMLLGWGARDVRSETSLLLVFPLIVAISFFLVADIDTPRGGVIRVSPQNLQSLAGSLRAP